MMRIIIYNVTPSEKKKKKKTFEILEGCCNRRRWGVMFSRDWEQLSQMTDVVSSSHTNSNGTITPKIKVGKYQKIVDFPSPLIQCT